MNAFGSVAQAFRAPIIDDLSTLGAFDYGVEVPPGSLDPERSISIEGGLKANTPRMAATFAAFRLQLRDLIDRLPATFEGSPIWDGQDVYQRASPTTRTRVRTSWTIRPSWDAALVAAPSDPTWPLWVRARATRRLKPPG